MRFRRNALDMLHIIDLHQREGLSCGLDCPKEPRRPLRLAEGQRHPR
jgi:hypothetical protein